MAVLPYDLFKAAIFIDVEIKVAPNQTSKLSNTLTYVLKVSLLLKNVENFFLIQTFQLAYDLMHIC